MPAISVTYDEDEIRALIAKDVSERFGIRRPDDEDIQPDLSHSDGRWEVDIGSGNLDASKARHVDES
ncbi:hypothetical protein AYJ57_21315 (plasmid) [Salipiger sp. CCB-MM3]|uniref:hypothetical protein n=1 Tax=Salipiger sp. CCB-MM3 TaxID=1792508 RepID=UPI00080ABCC9|nr:hypothetical protein [Salipiger sp. CCB-MM3]ANT63017.1 hypothetical protein AYJ57_21315 [Salipiger sp. CCB-MM3]